MAQRSGVLPQLARLVGLVAEACAAMPPAHPTAAAAEHGGRYDSGGVDGAARRRLALNLDMTTWLCRSLTEARLGAETARLLVVQCAL